MKDRLPAFSGIAQLFVEVTGDEYVAGLWRSRIIDQLVWQALEPAKPLLDSDVPSWSWAAVQGKVKAAGQPQKAPIP